MQACAACAVARCDTVLRCCGVSLMELVLCSNAVRRVQRYCQDGRTCRSYWTEQVQVLKVLKQGSGELWWFVDAEEELI